MKYEIHCERRDLSCNHSSGDLFTCEISCFRAKAHLVFHRCLYNKRYFGATKQEDNVLIRNGILGYAFSEVIKLQCGKKSYT